MVQGLKVQPENAISSEHTDTLEVWHQRIWHALRHLDDRSILNQSPLARLVYVQRVADYKFKGNALVKGLALKYVLLSCVDRLIAELSEEPSLSRSCEFLKLIKQGQNITAISKKLNLSREHVTRFYKRKAVDLVTQEFLRVIKKKRIS